MLTERSKVGLVPEGRGKWSGRTECRETGQQWGWLEAEQRLGLRPQLAEKPVSLMAHTVKTLPAMQETQVQSLGQEDPRRRKWQSHGQRSRGMTELDATK